MRLIESYIPEATMEDVEPLLAELESLNVWHHGHSDSDLYVKVLVPKEQAGTVLDALQKHYGHREGYRSVVLPVEAVAPLPKEKKEEEVEPETDETAADKKAKQAGIAREELYADISEGSRPSRQYAAMVILSAVVAGIGIARDNTAIVIGAMVIAPLLGPNVALSLSTTLADWNLTRRALRTLLLGVALALGISVLWGLFMPLAPDAPGMPSRTIVGYGDVALAIASGCAGVLSFTSGAASALVGVMVAVALLPPLVTAGLMFGGGYGVAGGGALMVFLTNVICINLAGTVTFLVQGIRPLTWWEARRARKATPLAIGLWVVLLAILIAAIVLSRA